MVKAYIPDRRDIILIDLHPQKGKEMNKRRPCLVLTPKALNLKLGRVLVCPITSTSPQILTHISLASSQKNVKGTLVVDQLKTLDFRGRNAKKIAVLVDESIYQRVVETVAVLING